MSADIGYTNFFLQYWFILLMLGIGMIVIIIYNGGAFYYLSLKKPIDPLQIIPELEADEQRQLMRKEKNDKMKAEREAQLEEVENQVETNNETNDDSYERLKTGRSSIRNLSSPRISIISEYSARSARPSLSKTPRIQSRNNSVSVALPEALTEEM